VSPTISSTSNRRVRAALRLRSSARARRESGLFPIDGAREIELALEAGIELAEVFCWPEGLQGPDVERGERALAAAAAGATVTRAVAERLSYGERISSLVACARRPPALPLPRFGDSDLVLVLDGVEKPGNLGAALRSADAVGAAAVLACGACTDLYNPNTVRASRGAVFTLPVAAPTPEEAAAALAELPIVVATPDAALDFREADLRPPLAVVVGSEHLGVSSYWRDRADRALRIPMLGRADSLNVSVCAALLLFEASR